MDDECHILGISGLADEKRCSPKAALLFASLVALLLLPLLPNLFSVVAVPKAAQRSAGVRGEINGEIWPPSGERRHREGKRAWHFDSGSAAVEDGKPRSELMLPMLQLLFDSHELFRHKIPVLYPLLLVV